MGLANKKAKIVETVAAKFADYILLKCGQLTDMRQYEL
jgi:hypothetical protein